MSDAADPAHIAELFSAFGSITVRRMFGGAGLFLDGMMFGLVDDGVIYFKTDERTIPAFEREGLGPFSYATKTGTHTLASYWRMPERLYDDPDELAHWAAQALETPQKCAARKKQTSTPSETIKMSERFGATLRIERTPQATFGSFSTSISGSISQITRLRPLRLAE